MSQHGADNAVYTHDPMGLGLESRDLGGHKDGLNSQQLPGQAGGGAGEGQGLEAGSVHAPHLMTGSEAWGSRQGYHSHAIDQQQQQQRLPSSTPTAMSTEPKTTSTAKLGDPMTEDRLIERILPSSEGLLDKGRHDSPTYMLTSDAANEASSSPVSFGLGDDDMVDGPDWYQEWVPGVGVGATRGGAIATNGSRAGPRMGAGDLPSGGYYGPGPALSGIPGIATSQGYSYFGAPSTDTSRQSQQVPLQQLAFPVPLRGISERANTDTSFATAATAGSDTQGYHAGNTPFLAGLGPSLSVSSIGSGGRDGGEASSRVAPSDSSGGSGGSFSGAQMGSLSNSNHGRHQQDQERALQQLINESLMPSLGDPRGDQLVPQVRVGARDEMDGWVRASVSPGTTGVIAIESALQCRNSQPSALTHSPPFFTCSPCFPPP